MTLRSFSDPDTEFKIVKSGSPPTVDGLAITEPKFLRCSECGAQVRIDGPDGNQTSIEELPHDRGCSQRDMKSEWWIDTFVDS